jgi:hypothetical protein
MNILELGRLIDPEEFTSYIEAAEGLETIIHKYGGNTVVPDYPCWIEYKNEGGITGSISFSRHTGKHPILSEMSKKVADVLRPIFPEKYEPEINRVHLIRTKGDIPIHRDEAGRLTCINIGLKNSSEAVTCMGASDIPREEFYKTHSKTILKDGYGYLVNTHEWHSVNAMSDNPRYLITYGLGAKFDYFKKFLRIGTT